MASRLYDAAWVRETVARLADEIAANRAPGVEKAIVGLRTRGAQLAERLRGVLAPRFGDNLPIGYLDATLYRDDLHTGAGLKPVVGDQLFSLEGKGVILVDDVLSTGRTVRAAMEALFAYGRPASIRLCVMLDRGGRQLPIQADFVGGRVEVPPGGFVRLKLEEIDPQGDAVYVVAPGEDEP